MRSIVRAAFFSGFASEAKSNCSFEPGGFAAWQWSQRVPSARVKPRIVAISSSCVMFCGSTLRFLNSPVSARISFFCCCIAAQAARRTAAVTATKRIRIGCATYQFAMPATTAVTALSPADAVVLAVVARAAPERPVRAVEHDGVDRPRGPLLEDLRVPHLAQFAAHPRRRLRVEQDLAGRVFVAPERAPHLERVEVRRLGRLLRRHPELYDVEKELQEILILAVAALHREDEPRQTVFQRQRRRQRDARMLPRLPAVDRVPP